MSMAPKQPSAGAASGSPTVAGVHREELISGGVALSPDKFQFKSSSDGMPIEAYKWEPPSPSAVMGAGQPDPEETVSSGQPSAVALTLVDGQLLAERGVLKKQVAAVCKSVTELKDKGGDQTEHDATLDSDRLLGPHTYKGFVRVQRTRLFVPKGQT
jgi:hypothetical protein